MLSKKNALKKVIRAIHKYLNIAQTRIFSQFSRREQSLDDFLRSLTPGFPGGDYFLEHLAKRSHPVFFLTEDGSDDITVIKNRFSPATKQGVLARADLICEHIFDLLGSGPKFLGEKINWHLDFKSGHQWDPDQFFKDIKPAGYPGGYDIKVPWELSRFQHAAWLGQAYWLSSDDKYALEFVSQVSDWLIKNPWPRGVNWSCTMDVSIRAVNWLWGYFFFKDSPALVDKFRYDFLKSLLIHGRHIWKNLEWSPWLTSNHYLADIVGLVFIGILLPEFKESKRWREYGLRELEIEMFSQVLPDGVDFEASIGYHRLVTELFLSATILARLNSYQLSPAFMDRLEKMLEYIQHMTRPDGTVPIIGDNDNGRLHRLNTWEQPEREWVDFRYLFAIGAVLYQRSDFAHSAGDQWQEAIWLFGKQAIQYQDSLTDKSSELLSQSYKDSGMYILRHKDAHLTINASTNGQNGIGGHAHNDILGITLQVNRQDWLIDAGTYTYTGDYIARNAFRSARLHNVVMVDGKEQILINPNKIFELRPDIPHRVNRWNSSEYYDLLDVSINYERIHDESLEHHRQVFLPKAGFPYCLIRDVITGVGIHNLELLFQIGNSDIIVITQQYVLLEKNHRENSLGIFQLTPVPFDQGIIQTERSTSYGIKIPNRTLWYRKSGELPVFFLTLICWSETLDKINSHPDQLQEIIDPALSVMQAIPA